jgi:hypothetical protein
MQHYLTIPQSEAGQATPLIHVAAKMGNPALLQFLEAQGADLTTQDANSQTILHKAVSAQNVGTVHYILQRGVINPNAADDKGNTPLHLAVKQLQQQQKQADQDETHFPHRYFVQNLIYTLS